MKRGMTILAAVTLAAGLGATAVADHQSTQGDAQLHEVMNRGAREMQSMSMTGDVDHDFVMAMKKHHQDGIEMAKVMLKHGKDARARQFAQKIIDSQTKEIGEFDQWMDQHADTMHGASTTTPTPR